MELVHPIKVQTVNLYLVSQENAMMQIVCVERAKKGIIQILKLTIRLLLMKETFVNQENLMFYLEIFALN